MDCQPELTLPLSCIVRYFVTATRIVTNMLPKVVVGKVREGRAEGRHRLPPCQLQAFEDNVEGWQLF